MERVLTGKLLTGKLTTGIFSTDKVGSKVQNLLFKLNRGLSIIREYQLSPNIIELNRTDYKTIHFRSFTFRNNLAFLSNR